MGRLRSFPNSQLGNQVLGGCADSRKPNRSQMSQQEALQHINKLIGDITRSKGLTPQGVKGRLRGYWKNLRLGILRGTCSFSSADLLRTFGTLGIGPGDTVLVLSLLDQFGA